MDSNEFDVRRTVVSVLEQCAKCKHQYSPEDARVVQRQGELWVLSVRCSHCDTQAYVAAVVGSDVADMREVMAAEVDDVDAAPDASISVDDVLDVHEFLETFSGDFAALFHRGHR